jgi:hypothetical protein
MKIKPLLIICLMAGLQVSAQLTGTYTIGGVFPDYATFSDAVAALNSTGVSGPVTFNVRNGIYNEKIVINDIPNSSAVNTITFQSEDLDSSVVTLMDSSTTTTTNNYLVQLNGADFVTFKQLGFRRPGTGTYATVFSISNFSTNNSFLNNYVEGAAAATSTTNSSLFFSAAGTTSNDSNNVFMNNRLVNGSYGFSMFGASTTIIERGTVIENNIFENMYSRAVNLGNQNAPRIVGNTITTNTTIASFYGLYFSSCENNVQITGNKVDCPNGGYGLYFTGCDGAAGVPINVINNFVHVGGAATSYGVYVTTSTNINFWHNSIHVSGTGATSRCFYATGAATIKLVVQNNLLINSGGGVTYYIVSTAVPGLSISNYNDLYTTGASLAYWDVANTATLADWQLASSKDANSVSADPIFASNSDLHVFGGAVNDAGTPIPSVTTDIDGDLRSLTTPDIGADEFLPLDDNMAILAMTQPVALGACGQAAVSIEISVANYGSNSQSAIPVVVEITGAMTMTILDTIPGPIALNTTASHMISQTISTVTGGEFFFKIYSSLTVDQFRDNDTINVKRTFYTIPNDPTAASTQQGCNTSVGIVATPDSGNVIFWYDALTGGNLVGIGSPLTVPITSDTAFFAEAREGGGSGGCLRIVECELGTTDYIEIQNLSGAAFDATGWTVAISNSYSDINSVNSITWALGNFAPGEIQYKSDAATDNYWGNNILYNPGSAGWIVLLDPANAVRDFLPFLWTDAQIQAMSPMVNAVPITIGTEWTGDGVANCGVPTVSRIGNSDNNNATDFACETGTKGTQNANMSASFANCGLGLCGSGRVAVQVTMITGVSTDLGPDTTFVSPFTYTLDAGSGFTAYMWSDGSTAQTLDVTAPGTYWVTVEGANGCSFTDSVEVSIFTGIQMISANDQVQAYPNPANQHLTVNYTGSDAIARIIDLNGRIIRIQNMESVSGISVSTFDLNNVETGLYFVQVMNKEEVLTMKLIVQHQ